MHVHFQSVDCGLLIKVHLHVINKLTHPSYSNVLLRTAERSIGQKHLWTTTFEFIQKLILTDVLRRDAGNRSTLPRVLLDIINYGMLLAIVQLLWSKNYAIRLSEFKRDTQ